MKQMIISAVIFTLIMPARKILHKRRLLNTLHDDLANDIGMHHWKAASNKATRIARVKSF